MLIINPRSFYMSSVGPSPNFASGRGIIGGATGASSAGPGVGSRPWLQKVATLAVAIAMTIATADTFKVAEKQWIAGFMDADAMRAQVEGTLEIRVTRVISDIFLWLAEVQTLIRLFPRHKEKILIKWIGFALIILDTTFSCLNSFMIDSLNRPRHFVDAIPALSYLFELAVGLLYAAWVMFYGLSKRRYAYYHHRMKNICVVALLSHVAILTPVVFFVTDVSKPDVAAWGDYFRWVGAAAASVVVWEWVERIEALERDEKKDGILGREIFDGDEMLDFTPSEEMTYTRKPRDDYRPLSRAEEGTAKTTGGNSIGLSLRRRIKSTRRPNTHFPLGRTHSSPQEQRTITFGELPRPRFVVGSPDVKTQTTPPPLPPPAAIVPPNRADTTSAASTVYVVNYHGAPDAPQPVRRRPEDRPSLAAEVSTPDEQSGHDAATVTEFSKRHVNNLRWHSVGNRFKRKRMSPPAEVRAATEAQRRSAGTPQTAPNSFARWDVRSLIGAFAAETGERMRERRGGAAETADVDKLPWTIIPAQPRGAATWSPSMLDKDKSKSKETSGDWRQSGSGAAEVKREAGYSSGSGGEATGFSDSRQVTWSGTTTASSNQGLKASPGRSIESQAIAGSSGASASRSGFGESPCSAQAEATRQAMAAPPRVVFDLGRPTTEQDEAD